MNKLSKCFSVVASSLSIILALLVFSPAAFATEAATDPGGAAASSTDSGSGASGSGSGSATDCSTIQGQYANDGGTCVCPPGTDVQTDSDGNKACEDEADQAKCSSSSCDIIGDYVNPAINVLSVIAGLIFVISIIVGGIQYSSAGGDPQKVANARKRIANTIISLVAYIFFYAFLQFLVPGGLFN